MPWRRWRSAASSCFVAVALGIANLLGWPAWTGFLIVAILLCIGGFFTLSSGRKQLASVHALPGETVTTLKENSEWIAKLAVIRSEMSQTKAELDYKISQLQRKTHAMTPRAVARRFMPERALDYAIGGVLTVVGARMAWGRFRATAAGGASEDSRGWPELVAPGSTPNSRTISLEVGRWDLSVSNLQVDHVQQG